jgi:carbon storage regulator
VEIDTGSLDKDAAMLVLTRKVGQRILIGENVAVTVVRVSQGTVRLGIEAPPETPIVREELQMQLDAGEEPVVDASPPV